MPTNADEFAAATARVGKQLPFAISLAINKTAEDVQRFQVAHMHKVFDVRRPNFIGSPSAPHRSAIKRTHKATKGQPVAELAVSPPGGQQRADIIARHESDRERKPRGNSLAIPAEHARRGKRQNIPAKLRPKALDLQPHGGTGRVFKGGERTFLVTGLRGGDVIFQRTSRRGSKRKKRGKGYAAMGGANPFAGTKKLWSLKKSTKLDQRLEFVSNAGKVFKDKHGANFADAVRQALETAR